MPSFFGAVTGKTSATLFEIRLDNDLVILRGSENEASSQMLSGTVILCVPAALKVEDVHLRLSGTLRVAWNDQKMTANGLSSNRVERTTSLLDHRFPPFVGGEESGRASSSKGTVLPAGNYEWPFEFMIPGTQAESVEGLLDTHLSYKLKATVARGKFAYDLHAYKPVRIIRTLDPAALELSHAMTVENVWPNKIEYSIVIPQKAIIFGTSIAVSMRFTSLLKGLKIGTIRCTLVETHEFFIPAAAQHHVAEKNHKTTREVGHWSSELSEEDYQDMIEETGQDGWCLTQSLPLPKSLRKCVQDCETNGVKIRHKVKFNVALLNPDGHTSELRATLPVYIFISPNMPIDESGNLLDQTPNMSSTNMADVSHHAPPLYGEHVLDQLYADIDNSGLMTPASQSGMSTPFQSQSRRGSIDNTHSLDEVANGAVPPLALTNRLQNLAQSSRNSSFLRQPQRNGSGSNTPRHGHDDNETHHSPNNYSNPGSVPRAQSGYFGERTSHPNSAPHSNPLSRRTSEEDNHAAVDAVSTTGTYGVTSGAQTPEHIDFSNALQISREASIAADLANLSKVPSYSTAVRTPARGMSYSDLSHLPNYNEATSRPGSPVHPGQVQPMSLGQGRNGSVGSMGPPMLPSSSLGDLGGYFTRLTHGSASASGRSTPIVATAANTNAAAARTPGAVVPGAGVADDYAGRRLHLLQLRGRAH